MKTIEKIRYWMKQNEVDAVYISCTDPHQSESVAEHWKTVQWLTGFTGSMGYAIVTTKEAAFWSDGRYLEQSQREIDSEIFQIENFSKQDSPSWDQWLAKRMPQNGTFAFDGNVTSVETLRSFKQKLKSKNLRMHSDISGLLNIWCERPPLPGDGLYRLEDVFNCEDAATKLFRVRRALSESADFCLVCGLDDVIWLTNVRGNDNPLYPFFHAYLLLSQKEAFLCADIQKIPDSLQDTLRSEGFTLLPYEEIEHLIKDIPEGSSIRIDPYKTEARLFNAIPPNVNVVEAADLVTEIKVCKTEREQSNIRQANILECVAVVRLMMWIESESSHRKLNEYEIGQKLNEFRRKSSPLYLQPANRPIVGTAGNAAIPHYRPSQSTSSIVNPDTFLLFDVCAQYRCGSTDLTRCMALGKLTVQMCEDYTDVLRTHIALASLKFPAGTTGNLLDAVAKSTLWNEGKNFHHGIGHGIGYVSNIHEGLGKLCIEYAPAFPYAFKTPLKPGMVFSNEPGIYRSGQYGIRIENTVIVQEAEKTEFGQFFKFETVTFLPFENRAIIKERLTQRELDWIKQYYAKTRENLNPFLSDDERAWLAKRTDFFLI